MDIDQELRRALRRVDPPAGFRKRVLERADNIRGQAARIPRVSRVAAVPRWVAAGLMAATIGAMALGLGTYRDSRLAAERAEGIRARQELLLAVRITSRKTNVARMALEASAH